MELLIFYERMLKALEEALRQSAGEIIIEIPACCEAMMMQVKKSLEEQAEVRFESFCPFCGRELDCEVKPYKAKDSSMVV